MNIMNFYRVNDDFSDFSNFTPDPIKRDGALWPTSKPNFQAQKLENPSYQRKIQNANSPWEAARARLIYSEIQGQNACLLGSRTRAADLRA